MVKPTLRHFERAAQEVAAHGDNDTLPFDLDTRFCRDNSSGLAQIAFGFYQELKNGPEKENKQRISALDIYSERLIAPSGPAGFRVVTKISSFWNIYLNGLAIAIAEVLEPRRSATAYSYRFDSADGIKLFKTDSSWRVFKEATVEHANTRGEEAVVVQTDISSFYEHVSHHYIENFINELGGDGKQVALQITALLGKFSSGRSFGLPVGGQASRVLAELFLNQIDSALSANEISWHRYVDDYVLISSGTTDAYRDLSKLAQCLMDYGVSLNKGKTAFLSSGHYEDYVRAQLGLDEDEGSKLRAIDLKFDPYSDTPEEDYESLKDTVATLEVRKLLNRELEKALPDSFMVAQIGRTMTLHSPQIALDIASTFLAGSNLHAFRSSFSTIMRGIAHLRGNVAFSAIHILLDNLLDEMPKTSGHLLVVEANQLHYLRCLRFRRTEARAVFVRRLYDSAQLDTLRKACIDCWRNWEDRNAFNTLRNRWAQMSGELQRLFWLATYRFGDEGDAARMQFRHNISRSWALGVELPFDAEKDKQKIAMHIRGKEPLYGKLYEQWAKDFSDAH